MTSPSSESKTFYNAQHAGNRYAVYASPECHSFHHQLEFLISRYGNARGKWLEVGCGRGVLQDIVADYTGVDIADTVAPFLHKPFRCAPAETLPFPDSHFDGLWSYAVLEHVEYPEKAQTEMRRVLKPGGILLLAPAWQCRPWAGQNYAWEDYSALSFGNRIRKFIIPIRNSVLFRLIRIFPLRLFRLALFAFRGTPTPFRCLRLQPNYTEYRIVDADATQSMDPFETILWFRSRGDKVLSHPGWCRALLVRSGALVIEKGEA